MFHSFTTRQKHSLTAMGRMGLHATAIRISICLAFPTFANWTPMGLGGGFVKDFHASGKLIWEQDTRGYFRSIDSGESWVFRPTLFLFSALTVVGNSVFTGGRPDGSPTSGVWRSQDGLDTWDPLNFPQDSGQVEGLFTLGKSVLLVTENHIWISENDGLTWIQSQVTGIQTLHPNGFAAAGQDFFLESSGTVIRSGDSGATWVVTGMIPDSGSMNITALAGDDSVLIAQTHGRFYRSVDRGVNWKPMMNLPIGVSTTLVHAVSGFFVAVGDSVFRSADGGISWSKVGRVGASVTKLDADGEILYSSSDYVGISRSRDGGKTWTRLALPAATLQTLVDFDGTLFAGVFGDAALFRTADQGVHWEPSLTWNADPVSPPLLANGFSLARSGRNLFAIASSDGRMRRSGDGGSHWDADDGGKFSRLYQSGSGLFARADGYLSNPDSGFYRFDSTGSSWVRVSSDKPQDVLAALGSILFTVKDSVIYRSVDGGVSWLPSSQNLGDMRTLAVCGKDVFAGSRKDVSTVIRENVLPPRSSLFRSSDSGNTWDTVQTNLSNINVLTAYGPILFAGGASWVEALSGNSFQEHEPAVMRSEDGGVTWTDVSEGLDRYHADSQMDISTVSLVVSGSDLCVGTNGSGLWRRPLSELAPGVVLSVRQKNPAGRVRKTILTRSDVPRFDANGRRADLRRVRGRNAINGFR